MAKGNKNKNGSPPDTFSNIVGNPNKYYWYYKGRAYIGEDNKSKREMIEVIKEARNNLVEHTGDKADLSAKNQMI